MVGIDVAPIRHTRVMSSSFAWVDYSSTHREDMARLLDAFRDKGTVDELGIGTIRDTFSDLLFPGTSTLHTRARYFFFVPWIITSITARRLPLERATRELHHLEVRLIEALRSGDLEGGVIGRDARAGLKRMPSTVYWNALSVYDIRRCGHTIQQHLRFAAQLTSLTVDEDDEVRLAMHSDPCFRHLPAPPDDWLRESTFTLTRDEAEFLRDRILDTAGSSYLGWLIVHGFDSDPVFPWNSSLHSTLPPEIAEALAHARDFSILHRGAAILYNLLLARQKGWLEGEENYTNVMTSWSTSEETHQAAKQWNTHAFWRCISKARWRSNNATRTFVENWVSLVQSGIDLLHDERARTLISQREWSLKGRRSRFVNNDALSAWQGDIGMSQMTYRWAEAKQVVRDVQEGLASINA